MVRIGVISDTHGLLRPEAVTFLRGADFIVHAGDIGNADILAQLAALAPLTAVRGNNDFAPWADDVPETATLRVGDVLVHVLHDLAGLALDPAAAGFHVVVSGHSHRPLVDRRDGVLYLNPGSAGPRRFTLPIAAAEIFVSGAGVEARVVELGSGR